MKLHRAHVLTAVVVLSLVSGLASQSTDTGQVTTKRPKKSPDVIFVPTPYEVVDEMLRMAEVDKNDMVYDLGCGDGRLVVTAAKKYGARGVGIDIDPQRISESRANAKKEGVESRVEFREADLFESDISPATAVTLYLLSSLNQKLRPKLMAELKPGTPIVSHDFDMGDWKPEETKTINAGGREHSIFRWTIPAKAAGTWEWTQPGPSGAQRYRLTLAQSYSAVTGVLSVDGREMPIRNGLVRGVSLSFDADDRGEMTFAGRVIGKKIAGTVTSSAGERRWAATLIDRHDRAVASSQ